MSIYHTLIELAKAAKDIAQPLTLVAFLAVVLLGLVYLILKPIPDLTKHLKEKIRRGDPAEIARQILSSLFWLAVIVLCLGFAVQVLVLLHKVEQPAALPNITPPPPAVQQLPQHQYKLVWFNHEDGKLWEVRSTNTNITEVRNGQFKSWCAPFDESQFVVHQRRLVAGDEHFKESANWWTVAPYGLPALNERWLQIMDDEKWYFYEVVPK